MNTELFLGLTALCRIMLGLIFVASGISKTKDLTSFQQTISQFGIIPKFAIRFVAIIFILTEFAISVLMLYGGNWLLLGFILSGSLLVIFSIALASVLVRRITTTCNCFGSTNKNVTSYDLWRNFGLIVLAVTGAISFLISGQTQKVLSLSEWGLVGLMTITLALIWLNSKYILKFIRS